MKKAKKKPPLAWKRGNDWIQFSPPCNHPSTEEWKKQQEKANDGSRKITNEMMLNARDKVADMHKDGHLKNSIRRGAGALGGFLGEQIAH